MDCSRWLQLGYGMGLVTALVSDVQLEIRFNMGSLDEHQHLIVSSPAREEGDLVYTDAGENATQRR